MKTLLTTILSALLALSATANEIIRGTTLSDGQQLYASDLHNLIDSATIGIQFYNDQQTTPVLGSGYYFLVLDPATQTYRRITAQTAIYGNTNIFLNVPVKPVPVYGTLMFYDPTNGWLGTTTISNLFVGQSSNINVAALKFATTNNAGATNQYVLPYWTNPFSGLNTNYPAHFLVFDTNGVPYRHSLSNLEVGVAADLGTVFSLPYEYNMMFNPWLYEGTNNYGFTNAWGFQTNFPINALYVTNSYPASTNTPTLVDADQVPVNSTQQQTNTTATLGSIYQYLAAKNTLPPYTQARVQFNGNQVTVTVSNAADNINGLIRVATNSFTSGIYPVTFNTNSISAAIITNNLYFVAPQATNNSWLHVYSNYPTAFAGTNWIAVASSSVGVSQIYYVTNYTSYNADVIPQLSAPSTIKSGVYSMCFRTNAANSFYYVTGIAAADDSQSGSGNLTPLVALDNSYMPSTNSVVVQTVNANPSGGTGHVVSSLVQILVNPQ